MHVYVGGRFTALVQQHFILSVFGVEVFLEMFSKIRIKVEIKGKIKLGVH